IPCYAEITNLRNGRKVVVRINDRGPFVGDRIVDLSYTAAAKLDMLTAGTAPVELRVLTPGREAAGSALPPTEPAAPPPRVLPRAPGPPPPRPPRRDRGERAGRPGRRCECHVHPGGNVRRSRERAPARRATARRGRGARQSRRPGAWRSHPASRARRTVR